MQADPLLPAQHYAVGGQQRAWLCTEQGLPHWRMRTRTASAYGVLPMSLCVSACENPGKRELFLTARLQMRKPDLERACEAHSPDHPRPPLSVPPEVVVRPRRAIRAPHL